MNALLKIVQGPNAGAEIVLAEGMTVSIGKGDSCDILLADQSLADVACELEVAEGRVRMLLPGGAEERLEPFRVRFLGETTAVAVGPETGAWDELVWPARGVAPAAEAELGEASEESGDGAPAAGESEEPPKREKRSCGCGCTTGLLLLAAAVPAAVFLAWPFRSGISGWLGPAAKPIAPVARSVHDAGMSMYGKVCAIAREWRTAREKDLPAAVAAPPDIRAVAAAYGLSCTEKGGVFSVSGNFATRAERLAATAAVYEACPGVALELSDDESLRTAVAEVLDLVSEGSLKVYSATNRILAISGFSPSAAELRRTLEAIRADVPYVRNVDCALVRLGDVGGAVEIAGKATDDPASPAVKGVQVSRVRRDRRKSTAPKMPVVGVMTLPYPCLVLSDGSRVTEGADFGGFVIEKISADTIRVRGPEGTFEWRP